MARPSSVNLLPRLRTGIDRCHKKLDVLAMSLTRARHSNQRVVSSINPICYFARNSSEWRKYLFAFDMDNSMVLEPIKIKKKTGVDNRKMV